MRSSVPPFASGCSNSQLASRIPWGAGSSRLSSPRTRPLRFPTCVTNWFRFAKARCSGGTNRSGLPTGFSPSPLCRIRLLKFPTCVTDPLGGRLQPVPLSSHPAAQIPTCVTNWFRFAKSRCSSGTNRSGLRRASASPLSPRTRPLKFPTCVTAPRGTGFSPSPSVASGRSNSRLASQIGFVSQNHAVPAKRIAVARSRQAARDSSREPPMAQIPCPLNRSVDFCQFRFHSSSHVLWFGQGGLKI